jgi:hypothetical protein
MLVIIHVLSVLVMLFAAQRFVDTGDGICLALVIGCSWIGRFAR